MEKPKKISDLHFDDTIPDSLNIDDWGEECQNSCVNRGYNKGLEVNEAYNKSRELDVGEVEKELSDFDHKIYNCCVAAYKGTGCYSGLWFLMHIIALQIAARFSKPEIKLPEKRPEVRNHADGIHADYLHDNVVFNKTIDLVAEMNGGEKRG